MAGSIMCIGLLVFVSPQFSNQLVSSVIFVQYNITVEPNISNAGVHHGGGGGGGASFQG